MLKQVKMVMTLGDTGQPRLLGFLALVGFFVGGSRAILGRKPSTRWYDLIAAAVVCASASFITGCVLLYLWGPEKALLIIPIASVLGFVGVAAMDMAGGLALASAYKRIGAFTGETQEKEDE